MLMTQLTPKFLVFSLESVEFLIRNNILDFKIQYLSKLIMTFIN